MQCANTLHMFNTVAQLCLCSSCMLLVTAQHGVYNLLCYEWMCVSMHCLW
jgi:hypothetical protein